MLKNRHVLPNRSDDFLRNVTDDQFLPILGSRRDDDSVRIDNSAGAAEYCRAVRAGSVRRDEIALVFNRPGSNERLPVNQSRERPGRAEHQNVGAAQHKLTAHFREAEIVTNHQSKSEAGDADRLQ